MDKIFSEIKRAMEDEMARQEGRPVPTREPRTREASEYEQWLRQEQERLRGGGEPQRQSEESLEFDEPVVISEEHAPRHVPQERQSQRAQQSKRTQQRGQPQQRKIEPEVKAEPPPRRESRHERSEARQQRRSDRAYERRLASELRGEISTSLRSRQGLRKAILMNEILGRPVSLRRQDENLII